jgi:tRNA modification GTPase
MTVYGIPMFDSKDSIVAIATASGRGAIGVVRVSGAAASGVAQAICRKSLQARHAHFGAFFDADNSAIDQGIALFFKGPHSYTGEDVLELQAHGGPFVLQRLLKACHLAGAAHSLRLAEPGEFSRRAFLNDKLDLAQAEAVADLIDAASEQAARSAARSLSGEFSQAVHELAERIIHLRMLVEATLDFPEEEIEFLEKANALGQLSAIEAQLAQLQSKAQQGAVLREGLSVVLAGRPNVGKSSLLNALAGEEVAIVTPIAGTTRDKIQQRITIAGVPLNIIDTAGLRDTQDEVERIGVERTREAIANADVVLHLFDGGEGITAEDCEIEKSLVPLRAKQVRVINVWNKSDLGAPPANADIQLLVSCKLRTNILALKDILLQVSGFQAGNEDVFLARERHLVALATTAEHLHAARAVAQQGDKALDLFAEELRLAHKALQSITGEFSADDLLGEIFSRFCIGK